MSVPTHFRFVVRGVFGGSPEEWSTSAHFTRTNVANEDATFGDIDEAGVTSAVQAYFQSSLYPTNVIVTDWRMYQIGTNGKMQGNGPLLHEFADLSVHGTAGPWQLPPQVSLVHTLVAENRGPARFGRMYTPTPNVSLDTSGRVPIDQVGSQRVGITTFLKSISDQIDLDELNSSEGCNISPGPAGSSSGTLQVIDHIETGRVLDTIRNRRKSMLEDRDVGGTIDW